MRCAATHRKLVELLFFLQKPHRKDGVQVVKKLYITIFLEMRLNWCLHLDRNPFFHNCAALVVNVPDTSIMQY